MRECKSVIVRVGRSLCFGIIGMSISLIVATLLQRMAWSCWGYAISGETGFIIAVAIFSVLVISRESILAKKKAISIGDETTFVSSYIGGLIGMFITGFIASR